MAWQFEPRGLITVPRAAVDADEVALMAIDAGRRRRGHRRPDPIEIYTEPGDLERVRKGLEAAGVKIESAELTMHAKNTVEVDAAHARQNLRLVETWRTTTTSSA